MHRIVFIIIVLSLPVSGVDVVTTIGGPGLHRGTMCVRAGSIQRTMTVYAAVPQSRTRAVYLILHGYEPAGDPYRQHPGVFITNWKLGERAAIENIASILPEMGTAMYSFRERADTINEITWLTALLKQWIPERFPGIPVVLAGVSTGAEGVIKLWSRAPERVSRLVLLSGTYDLFSLPRHSGEYRLHEAVFGIDTAAWSNENPVSLFLGRRMPPIVLLCEERSIYRQQAVTLRDTLGTAVDDRLSLGTGYTHEWRFWGDARVQAAIFDIDKRSVRE